MTKTTSNPKKTKTKTTDATAKTRKKRVHVSSRGENGLLPLVPQKNLNKLKRRYGLSQCPKESDQAVHRFVLETVARAHTLSAIAAVGRQQSSQTTRDAHGAWQHLGFARVL